jgi:hypothetical protein
MILQLGGVVKVATERWIYVLALLFLSSPAAEAQLNKQCSTDRTVSMLVGAGLGLAAGAIPATIVHRHDQSSSHRIVAGSVAGGALIGLLAASRDRPCVLRADSLHIADAVIASRSGHAKRGALTGVVIGGVVGAAGSAFLNVGCERDPCNGSRAPLTLFLGGEGAVAGGILGSLIGWAWPVGR